MQGWEAGQGSHGQAAHAGQKLCGAAAAQAAREPLQRRRQALQRGAQAAAPLLPLLVGEVDLAQAGRGAAQLSMSRLGGGGREAGTLLSSMQPRRL